MLDIDVKADIKNTRRFMRGFEKQIPFATAKALTSTGQIVKEAERKEIKRVFDRPVRRTQSAVYLKRATKSRLSALVWIVDDAYKGTAPIKYLRHHIYGGNRNRTRFEMALERRGFLGSNEYVVASKYAKRNAYGNVTAGTYTRVLSQLSASPDPMQNRTDSARSRRSRRAAAYFYKRTGQARGIWERRGKTVKPLFVFVSRPTYSKRLDFFGIANKKTKQHFKTEFRKAATHAVATAR